MERIRALWVDGKITIIWLLVSAVYLGLKLSHTDAPEFTNAFIGVTGVFVADLGVKQTKKSTEKATRVEKKADHAIHVAESAVEAATGEMPALVHDEKTGDVRPQRKPKIARPKGEKNA